MFQIVVMSVVFGTKAILSFTFYLNFQHKMHQFCAGLVITCVSIKLHVFVCFSNCACVRFLNWCSLFWFLCYSYLLKNTHINVCRCSTNSVYIVVTVIFYTVSYYVIWCFNCTVYMMHSAACVDFWGLVSDEVWQFMMFCVHLC